MPVGREVGGDVGVPSVIVTGFVKLTYCQPEAVSLVKVAWASSVAVGRPQAADVRAGVGGAPCRSGCLSPSRTSEEVNLTPSSVEVAVAGFDVVGRGEVEDRVFGADRCRARPIRRRADSVRSR